MRRATTELVFRLRSATEYMEEEDAAREVIGGVKEFVAAHPEWFA